MKSFSLSTLLLVITVAALVLAQVVALRQLKSVQADADQVRRKYGHIRVEDPSKTYVFRFVNDSYGHALPDGIDPDESFRIVMPAGAEYVLHLSDMTETRFAYPSVDALVPTKTISLAPQRRSIVISRAIVRQENSPRVVVSSGFELLFDYVAPNWPGGMTSTTESWPRLGFSQTEFEPDETIRLFWWAEDNAQRGFMLWLEPRERWLERRDSQSVTTEQPEKPDPN